MITHRLLLYTTILLALPGVLSAQRQRVLAEENLLLRKRVADADRRIAEADRRVADMEARAAVLAEQVQRLKQELADIPHPPPPAARKPSSPAPEPKPVRNDLPLRFVLELTDHSRVIGTPAVKALPVKTSYADMEIQVEKFRTVTVSNGMEIASIRLRNGDQLKGSLTVDSFEITTVFGKISVKSTHVTRLTVLAAGEPLSADHPAAIGSHEIEDRMRKTIIPELEFRAANIRDVIDFFQEHSRRSGDGKGVNMALDLKGAEVPLITFKARRITLLEAMRIVMEVGNLHYEIRHGVLFIQPKQLKLGAMRRIDR